MKKRCIRRIAVNGLAALTLAAATTAIADSSGTWQNREEVYGKVCGHCHETGVGPVIKGRELPEEYIRRVVRMGNRAMPSFRPSEINDAMLTDLARLVSAKPVR